MLKRDGRTAADVSCTATQSKDEMQSRFLLDIVVGKCPSVLQLFSSKDQALLIGWDAFLVLDLRLHIVNRVRRFYLKSDCLTCENVRACSHIVGCITGHKRLLTPVSVFTKICILDTCVRAQGSRASRTRSCKSTA